MATKKKPTTETATKPKNVLEVQMKSGETEDMAMARFFTRPEVHAARTIREWRNDGIEINALLNELSAQIADVNKGDLKRPEAMLMAQANTLDELFNNLARRASNRDSLQHMEALFRLALKAQSQCRSTLETLAAIKNPPIVYAKQANIAAGHQQVNNGIASPATRGGNQKSAKRTTINGVTA